MGGRRAKPGPHIAYERELSKLEAKLDTETEPKALSDLAIAFHGVGYSLGHDIPAIIAKPDIVDRAEHGRLVAHERAAEAYAQIGNVKHAVFHLFEALDRGPPKPDRDRVGQRLATVLDPYAPAAAERMRVVLVELPGDRDKARDRFHAEREAIKRAFDWETLPTGR